MLSDKYETKIGKRMPYYVIGTLLVTPAFLGIFSYPEFAKPGGDMSPITRKMYYIVCGGLFNMGWSSVQISHLSVVNQLSMSNQQRDMLTNNRNGSNYAANIAILACAFVVFYIIDDSITQYRVLCGITLGVGLATSLFFICGVDEARLTKEAKIYDKAYKKALAAEAMGDQLKGLEDNDTTELDEEGNEVEQQPKKSVMVASKDWKAWLKEGTFYIHGFVYVVARVAICVSMSLQPFYIVNVTGFEVTDAQPTPLELALVPFVSYVVSLLFSVFLQQRMTRCLRNRFLPMLLANLIIIGSSVPLCFLTPAENIRWLVYPLFALQGLGVAIMLNTATSLISDVIGNDTASSAFVYSIFSFTEKIANGVLLFFVSALYLQGEKPDPEPIKWITAMTPVVCGLLSYGFTWVGAKYFSHKLSKITGLKR